MQFHTAFVILAESYFATFEVLSNVVAFSFKRKEAPAGDGLDEIVFGVTDFDVLAHTFFGGLLHLGRSSHTD